MQIFYRFIKNKYKPTLNRFIFTTFKCHYEDLKVVKPYLLDRSRPASEILQFLDTEDLEELKIIKNEYNYLLASNVPVPSHLTDANYLDLLCLKETQRLKYLKKLSKNKAPLQKKSNPIPKVSLNENDSTIITNRFFPKFQKTDLMISNRLYQAKILKSQEVVIDLSFEAMMNLNTINQLGHNVAGVYNYNKQLKDPLQLILTQFQPNTITYSAVNKAFNFPVKYAKKTEDLLLDFSEKHYLDLFPNRRFVYLTPNSQNYFKPGEYDHEAIYIIGGFIEKSRELPVTLGRARAENIGHRAFPIDRYIDWKSGSKTLDILLAFKILASAQESDGNWKTALENHIPRKHYINTPKKSLAMKILDMSNEK